MRYSVKWPEYAKQWDRMVVNKSRRAEFAHIAEKLLVNKHNYTSIEQKTGVPWWLIAVLHERESDANFSTYLGNGQPLNRRTTIVPKGRGPFASFEDGAIDALKIDGLTDVKGWRLEKALYYCETFNGWGYANKNPPLPSPYIWGGTNIQKPGKFAEDHKFNSKVWDPQPGCAPILKTLADMDSSIQFVRES